MNQTHGLDFDELALIHIENAIDFFLSDSLEGYICALTLAGAAENVLGKYLSEVMKTPNALEENITNLLLKHGINEEHESFLKYKKEFIEILNHPRDMFKHFNVRHYNKEFDLHLFAKMMIDRSIFNYVKVTSKSTNKIQQYIEFVNVEEKEEHGS